MADSSDLDNYLTMGNSPDEDSIRHNLAKHAPSYASTVVYRTLHNLRSYRDGLENVLNPLGAPIAMMGVKQVFERACYLLIEIIDSSPQNGSAVGEQLFSLMENRDAGIRTLAIFFTGLKGIPPDLTTLALQKHFTDDEDLVVKMVAAVLLQREDSLSIQGEIQATAQAYISAYMGHVHQYSDHMSSFSADDLTDEEEAAINTAVILELMPRMIALQGVEY